MFIIDHRQEKWHSVTKGMALRDSRYPFCCKSSSCLGQGQLRKRRAINTAVIDLLTHDEQLQARFESIKDDTIVIVALCYRRRNDRYNFLATSWIDFRLVKACDLRYLMSTKNKSRIDHLVVMMRTGMSTRLLSAVGGG